MGRQLLPPLDPPTEAELANFEAALAALKAREFGVLLEYDLEHGLLDDPASAAAPPPRRRKVPAAPAPGARLISPAALAERWGCHRDTIYKRINRGELESVRIGGAVRIPLHVVEAIEN